MQILTYNDVFESGPEDGGIKVEPLVDLGLELNVTGEVLLGLVVLLCEEDEDGAALVEGQAGLPINEVGHVVLEVNLLRRGLKKCYSWTRVCSLAAYVLFIYLDWVTSAYF